MSILRIYAKKDCSISDVIEPNLLRRTKLCNDGAADSLQLFSIYNRLRTENINDNEKSRILIYFDINELFSKELNFDPLSEKKYFLKLFNVNHLETTPDNFTIVANPLTTSFTEGSGLNQDDFTDFQACNWVYKSEGVAWGNEGGDFDEDYESSQIFEDGLQDLSLDITEIVNAWKDNVISNHGLILRLIDNNENSTESFYKKKFSSRTTEFWFSKPIIQCVFYNNNNNDKNFSFVSDDSHEFFSKLIYKNIKFGDLYDCDGTNDLKINFYTSSAMIDTEFSQLAQRLTTGTYLGEFSYSGSSDYLYYKFTSSDDSKNYNSGYIKMNQYDTYYTSNDYNLTIPNLKMSYSNKEVARFNLFIKPKTNLQNFYTKFIERNESIIFNKLKFKLKRVVDDLVIFDYDMENNATLLNWDENGNYFYLDMSNLEKNYMYEISFKLKQTPFLSNEVNGKEFSERFKFKVV
jgi:hypothetical protein